MSLREESVYPVFQGSSASHHISQLVQEILELLVLTLVELDLLHQCVGGLLHHLLDVLLQALHIHRCELFQLVVGLLQLQALHLSQFHFLLQYLDLLCSLFVFHTNLDDLAPS